MSALKDKIINGIIAVEGGYSDNKNDSGGETMYGITKETARANGYNGSMRDLPRQLAFDIYARKYWDKLKLDDIEKLSPAIAEELADTGVNMGVGAAGKFLQRSLNVLNRQGKDYPDIPVDGVVGPGTVNTLAVFLTKRGAQGAAVMHKMLNALQGARYVELAEERSKDEEFMFGWFANRVS